MSADLFEAAGISEQPQGLPAQPGIDISIRMRVNGTDTRAMHEAIAQACLMVRLGHFGDRPLTVPIEAQQMTINNGAAQLEARITVRKRA